MIGGQKSKSSWVGRGVSKTRRCNSAKIGPGKVRRGARCGESGERRAENEELSPEKEMVDWSRMDLERGLEGGKITTPTTEMTSITTHRARAPPSIRRPHAVPAVRVIATRMGWVTRRRDRALRSKETQAPRRLKHKETREQGDSRARSELERREPQTTVRGWGMVQEG